MSRWIPTATTLVLVACLGLKAWDTAEEASVDEDGDGAIAEDDCDDSSAGVYPGADEICDGIDNNCDGQIDEGVLSTVYRDGDGDGYGDASTVMETCEPPPGSVTDGTDCDDTDPHTFPGATEACDGLDNDCDGSIDEDSADMGWYADDVDKDGYGAIGTMALQCEGVTNEYDCDDTDPDEPLLVDQATGSSSGDGSADAPFDTIQAGMDAAMGCVVVGAGSYTEAIDFGGRDLAVFALEGSDLTSINASSTSGPAVTFANSETSAAQLSGFTVTGGSGFVEESVDSWECTSIHTCNTYYTTYCGGGIYIDGADPSLDNLVLSGNELAPASTTTSGRDSYIVYSYGGGLCVVGGAPTLSQVDVLDNYADQGGGIYVDESSAVTFEQAWVVGNSATDGAGWMVDLGSASLTNVASAWNTASWSGGTALVSSGSLVTTNVTITGESATEGGGVYASGTGSYMAMNTIIAYTVEGSGVQTDASASYTGTYSDVYGNAGDNYMGPDDPTGADGNISENPQFVAWSNDGDTTNDDFNLDTTSPCIDAGSPTSASNDPDGSTNDMGAFGGPEGDWDD